MTTDPQRILVIGGAGFIGSVLCPLLKADGHTVIIMDKKPAPTDGSAATYIQGDIRNREDVDRAIANCQLVINLAAEHQDNVRPLSLYTDVNVTGASILCEAAEAAGVNRILFTSSVAVYGSQPRPMDEETSHDYFNEYGRTKHLAEGVFHDWLERGSERQLTVLRPTVVFGPGNRGNVYNFLRQLKHGPRVRIGDGRNVKSMAYVENIAAFIAFLVRRPVRYEVFNYADKPDCNVRELIAHIDAALGRPQNARLTIPYPVGLLMGYGFDALGFVLRRPLPISGVRIRKLCSPSEINAERAFATGFIAPVDLRAGLTDMINNQV